MTSHDIISLFGLVAHPEGGWYAETFRDVDTDEHGRSRSTAIYYLLEAGQRAARHRVDATEVWHHYAGAPMSLTVGDNQVILGDDLAAGQRPQAVVPAGAWQVAEAMGPWSLIGCTVAPGFQFDGFEMETE